MAAAHHPPTVRFPAASRPSPASPARVARRPAPPLGSAARPSRRPAPTIPGLGLAASGGAAVVRVAGLGVLDAADEVAYAALDRAEQFVVRTSPLTFLGLAPSTVARVVYAATSDLAHSLVTAA